MREPISKSTVSKTLRRFNETGSVKERPKTATKMMINDLIVHLDATNNPKTSVQQLALNHNVSRKTIQAIMKKEKFQSYRIHLVQELNEDGFKNVNTWSW